MRVLLVNDYATTQGGANIATLRLRDELRRRGHDARLFASRARDTEGLADYNCFGTMSRRRVVVEAANVSAFLGLRRALADFRPDVVHVRMFLTQLSPLILPLLRDVPSLYHAAIYESVCPMGTKLLPDRSVCGVRAGRVCLRERCTPFRAWLPQMAQMKLWRRWRGAFDVIVTNSYAVGRQLRADGIEATETIWSGVPDRGARPPLTSPPTIAFAGSLIPLKGADVLLRAFSKVAARVPEARLVIAGDGPERDNLRKLAAELGLAPRVTMTGHLDGDGVESAIRPAWVQAVPSFAEQFSLSALEAAMRGTAIVASSVGGMPEMVREGQTGFLVPAGDSEALARKLIELLESRALAEELGRAARADALARFTIGGCAEKFERLYERIRHARVGVTADGRATDERVGQPRAVKTGARR